MRGCKRLYEYKGKKYDINDMCKIAKRSKSSFRDLIRKGFTPYQIVNHRYNDNRRKHGMTGTRLYNIYDRMIQRCYYHKSNRYKYYGARGIVVCDEWLNDKTAFFEWALNNGYNDTLTIDRIDNNKGYSPDNCRWVDYSTQENNRRDNILLKYNNEWLTVKEIAQLENISWHNAYSQYVKGEKTRLPKKQLYEEVK